MTSVFQLYGRPLAENEPLPPLRIEGSFPSYQSGVPYEGRLQIVDSIGKCTVELLEGNLPPGWRLFVDNFNNEVVLTWDAYVAETSEPRLDVPNGDFEAGDERWNFGAGWSIQSGGAETGTYSGVFANQRGISSIESTRVPYNGETIHAEVRFQQGASSSGNLVGRILLIWCDEFGNMIPGGEGVSYTGGNLIRSGSNGEWRTSEVTASSPTAKTVAVGFSANRKKQNKLARVDNFTWNHQWRSGTDEDTDYYIGLRVTDSANRTADWYGDLFWDAVFFTTALYPVIVVEEITGCGAAAAAGFLQMPQDSVTGQGAFLSATITATTTFKTYNHPGSNDEAIEGHGQFLSATITATTAFKTYNHPGSNDEAIEGHGAFLSANITVTTGYITYNNGLADNITGRGFLQGVTLS